MNKLLSLLSITSLLFACSPSGNKQNNSNSNIVNQTKAKHTLMFYNVENLFDIIDDPKTKDNDFLPQSKKQWDKERFQSKVNKLAEVIEAIDANGPLFIGMVEVENAFVLEKLFSTNALKNINYNFAHFDSPDERGIDVALAYDADYFSVESKEALTVRLSNNDKTRDILYVKGTISGESEPFHIFVNHWPSRREGAEKSEPKRVNAAAVLRNKINQIQRKNTEAKIIVMGDFNDYPNNNSITNTLNAKNNYPETSGELFNLAAALEAENRGTYNYRGDWGMLDQVIVSQSMYSQNIGMYSIEKDGLKIFDEEFIMFYDKKFKEYKPNKTYGGTNYYGGYSDHLPIYIELNRN